MLNVGDTVPDFTLPLAKADGSKDPASFKSLLGKGPVVIGFFPLAFSGVCTKEMCDIRDHSASLGQLHATTVGFSTDTPHVNTQFAKINQFSYGIFSDANREVVQKLWPTMTVGGVHNVCKRGWMVVDRNGKIVGKWVTDTPTEWPGVKPIEEVLAKAK